MPLAGHHLAGDSDDREGLESIERSNGAHRLVAVHPRHHDVGQDEVDLFHAFENGQGLVAAFGDDHFRVTSFEQRGQREHVPEVVVDQENPSPFERMIVQRVVPHSIRFECSGIGRRRTVRADERQGTFRRRRDAWRNDGGCHRCGPTRRKEDGEIAAFARRAGQRDLTAEQADQLAAYGEAEAGATVDARCGAVALGE